MGKELRREPRIRLDLDVEVETAGTRYIFPTRNASFSGVFMVSDDPLPLRRLVRMNIDVDGEPVELLGMVAHSVNAADAHEQNKQPGMGVALFPMGETANERWRTFIRTEYERDPEAHAALMAAELPRLRIHLKNEKMHRHFFEKDYPSGEIFYRTPDLMEVGTRVVCEVRSADREPIELFAHVSEIVEGARRKRGIRLTFEELSEATSQRVDEYGDATPES